jgi:hypothetical protein
MFPLLRVIPEALSFNRQLSRDRCNCAHTGQSDVCDLPDVPFSEIAAGVNLRRHDMTTAQHVPAMGLYSSACCGSDLIFYHSDVFIRCPACGKLCDWKFMEDLLPWNEVGHLAGWSD